MTIRVVNFVPEELPSYRPDVDVLYSKELPKQGVHTTIFGMPLESNVDIKGQDTHLLTSKKTSNRHLDSLVYFFQSAKLAFSAKKHQFNLIQVRDMVWVGLMCLIISKLIKLPMTYWVSFLYAESRTMRAKDKNENIPKWKRPIILSRGLLEEFVIYKIILPHAERVYVQSHFMMDYMHTKKNIPIDKMLVVPMGVDFEKIDGFSEVMAQKVEQWGNAPVVGYLGSLDRLRKLETIIDAFYQAKQSVPELKLLFVGDSEVQMDRDFLQKYAEDLGLKDDFYITGWIATQEAWAYLKGVDMVIGFMNRGLLLDVSTPTKAMEYMALKKPMICNDSPDQLFVVTESNCGRITDGSSESYAEAIVGLVKQPMAQPELDRGFEFIRSQRSYECIGQMVSKDIFNVIKQDRKGML
ncbi:MAG: glycosyltransferase [Vibrio sp.]